MSEEQQDETGALLAQAAELFQKAATDTKNRDKVLKEVEATLSKIRLTDAPGLAESPIVQAFVKAMGFGDMAPGQTKAAGTLAERTRDWSWSDVSRLPRKHITAVDTITIWFQGLPFPVMAGEDYDLPEPFYDEYRRHLYAVRQAQLHEKWMLNVEGSPPPDQNWINESSALVRATTLIGAGHGRRGGSLGVGPIREFAEPGEEPPPVQGEKGG